LQTIWSGVTPSWNYLQRAEDLLASRSISFWDALIVVAAIEAGVTTLYSEDLAGVGPIPGINIINPFASRFRLIT
jgi:predicted nucleic acid-binding protein